MLPALANHHQQLGTRVAHEEIQKSKKQTRTLF
jgi:hypothetical protein